MTNTIAPKVCLRRAELLLGSRIIDVLRVTPDDEENFQKLNPLLGQKFSLRWLLEAVGPDPDHKCLVRERGTPQQFIKFDEDLYNREGPHDRDPWTEMQNLILEPAPGSGSTTFEDRVLSFAESQGWLGERLERFFTDDNSYDGESFSQWQGAIRSLHAAWKLKNWLKSGLVHKIREQIVWEESENHVLAFALPVPPGCEPGTFRFRLPVSVEEFRANLVGATAKRELLGLGQSILNFLLIDNSPTLMQRGRFLEGTLEIRLEPATLKDRLWHLLLQGDKLECYRQCSECSIWFDARQRDGKTLNSIYKNREYCGDRCKDRAKQRPLKRAWQLLQEGLALQAVADHPEVGLPLARVELLRDHQPAWLKRKAGPAKHKSNEHKRQKGSKVAREGGKDRVLF